MRILVTGSSGYVGHQIALRLAQAGLCVTGSARRPCDTLEGVEVLSGDHLAPGFVATIVEACDVVVHFAARTRGHNAESFYRDNELVTTMLCREAQRCGKRFVFISSDQAVYQTGFYGKSKRACEEIVAAEHSNFVIIRLTAVLGRYAPDMASTFSKIIQRLHDGPVLIVPGSCQFPIAPVWIGDIEVVLRQLFKLNNLPNAVFELCGPILTLSSLIELFEKRLGQSRMRVRLPIWPLQVTARILKPYKIFARLPLDALLDLGAPVRMSSDKLQRVVDFKPTDMASAVAQIEGLPFDSAMT